jgi:hypothetical protein
MRIGQAGVPRKTDTRIRILERGCIKQMNEKTAHKIAEEIYSDIWDMSKAQLKDFHLAFCLNVYNSMEGVTNQDLLIEFLEKHKKLSDKILESKKL